MSSDIGAAATVPTTSRWRNWGLPLLAAAAGALMVAEGMTLPLFAQYSGLGAGFLVVVIGAALLLLAAFLSVQILRGTNFEPEAAEGVDLESPMSWPAFGLAAAGLGLPIVTIPWLGFPLGAGLAYACIARAFGSRRPLVDVAIGLVLASATWFGFTRLGVQLGPFLPLLGR